MAYNPQNFIGYNGPSYYPMYQQQTPLAQPQQIQNGGFVPAPSEDFARNYPVAPGTTVSFRDENLPYLYTKTMGYSPLDHPIFEKFRRVEEDQEQSAEVVETTKYALKSDMDALCEEVKALRNELNRRKNFDKRRGDKDE